MAAPGKRKAPDISEDDPSDSSAHRTKRPSTTEPEIQQDPLDMVTFTTTYADGSNASASSSTPADSFDELCREHWMQVGGLSLEGSSSSWVLRDFSAMFEDQFTAPAGSIWPISSLDLNQAEFALEEGGIDWDPLARMDMDEYQDTVSAASEWRNMMLPGRDVDFYIPQTSSLYVHDVEPQTLQFLVRYTENRKKGLKSLQEAATLDSTITEELLFLQSQQSLYQSKMHTLRCYKNRDNVLAVIDDELPHVPGHVRLQMAELGSKLFEKYFAARRYEVQPDFTALELVCLCFWAKGSRLTKRDIIVWITKSFPYYRKFDPAVTDEALRLRPAEFVYENSEPRLTGRVPLFHSPDNTSSGRTNIARLVHEVMGVNGSCYERLFKCVGVKVLQSDSNGRRHAEHELMGGFEHKVFQSSNLMSKHAYRDSQVISTARSNPGSRTVPLLITALPMEVRHRIFKWVFADLDGYAVFTSGGIDEVVPEGAKRRQPELAFRASETQHESYYRKLPDLPDLLKASQTCLGLKDVVPEAFYKNTQFDVTRGLIWLRGLPIYDLRTLRKLSYKFCSKVKSQAINVAILKLVGENFPNIYLFEGSIDAPRPWKVREREQALTRFRDGKELNILSHYRGVKAVFTVNESWQSVAKSLLEEKLGWVQTCMAKGQKCKSRVLAVRPLAAATLAKKPPAELNDMVADYGGILNGAALMGKPKAVLAEFVAKKMRECYDNPPFDNNS